MKTLIRMFKDYDKHILFRHCQMHYFLILFGKTGDQFDFLPSFCQTLCQNLYRFKRYCTTFETI